MQNKTTIISVMEDAVFKAGKALVRDFSEIENLQVSKKGPRDFVTSADLKAESIIIKELQRARPTYGFLTEESGIIKGDDEKWRWILDPIDGTTNFMHGIPHFCISLALEKTEITGKKTLEAGVIYAPVLHEMFRAERGQGAFLNDKRLMSSGRNKLGDCLIAGYLRANQQSNEVNVEPLKDFPANLRILGSAALELAYVAAGKLDGFWHAGLKPWDMAAGILMVREARAMVTEINGGSNMMETGSILATNNAIYDNLRKRLSKHYK